MTELSPEALALLEAARRSHGPTEQERERVLGSLYASLGIAVPLALTASAAEAASAAKLAAGAQAAAAAQSAGQVAQLGTQALAAQAGAASAAKGGVWGLGVKLLTWNAGKVFLATLALGSAVGVGVHSLPRGVEHDANGARSVPAAARGRATVASARTVEAAPVAVAPHDDSSADESAALPRTSAGEPVVASAAPVVAKAVVEPGVAPAGDTAPIDVAAARPTVEPAALPVVTSQRVATPVTSGLVGSAAEVTSPSARAHRMVASHRTSTAHTRRRHLRSLAARESSRLDAQASEPASAAKLVEPVAAPASPVAENSVPATALAAPAPTTSVPEAGLGADKSVVPSVASAQPTGELALIRQALTRLRDHDPVAALALLDEHAVRYPSGAFATERRGLHVVALCAAGNLRDGRSEQANFLQKAASSPIAPRVRRACEEPKK